MQKFFMKYAEVLFIATSAQALKQLQSGNACRLIGARSTGAPGAGGPPVFTVTP